MTDTATPDLAALAQQLEHTLKLRVPPIGIQLLETAEELQAIARLRRPKAVHTMDQIVGQATRLGWTVGITAEDLVADQCRFVVGLGEDDPAWHTGAHMSGVWYATVEDATRHQAAMHRVPQGRYGGVLDDEMLMALTAADIAKALDGMQALARNGLRYPFPQYGIQMDARAGLGVSYPRKD